MEAKKLCSICHYNDHNERTRPNRKDEEKNNVMTNYDNDKQSLSEADFVNIACDDKFTDLLIDYFIAKEVRPSEESQSIKERFQKIYFDLNFEHNVFWRWGVHLYHVILTNKKSKYWVDFEDKIKEKYNILTRDDVVLAVSKEDSIYENTTSKYGYINILTDTFKQKKYIVTNPFKYDEI